MRELTTEREISARLTIDERPRRGPFRRVNGQLVLDALGIWWPVRSLLVGGALALVAAALWAWLAGR